MKNQKRRISKKIEFWVELISHIDSTWKAKKGSEWGYPFTGRDFKDLKHFALIFEPWGMMAIWDAYLDGSNEFNQKTGYTIYQFTRALPFLLDDKSWKNKANSYRDNLYRKLESNSYKEKVEPLVNAILEK